MLDIAPTKFLGMESHIANARLLTAIGLGVALDELHARIRVLNDRLVSEADPTERFSLSAQKVALHDMMVWCAEEMKRAGNG